VCLRRDDFADSVCRTASVETPDWAHSIDRSKKKFSLAIRPSLKVKTMNTGNTARRPLGVTPNRFPVIVMVTVPQQTSAWPSLTLPFSSTW
jgi:hypothetical protein